MPANLVPPARHANLGAAAGAPISGKRQLPLLSKSRFMSGRQCHLRLWNDCYEPALAAPIDTATQAIFDTGHAVGEFATRRYPGGELIDEDYLHQEEAAEHTERAMGSRAPALFEAAFFHRGVRVRVDLLVRAVGAWDLIEVKSTGSVKGAHIEDLAVQLWVARGAGVPVRRAGVLTLNTSYVYQGGDYDLDELFTFHDLTEEATKLADSVERDVARLQRMLAKKQPPRVEPSDHCHEPYGCPYLDHCTQDLPVVQFPVSSLPSLSHKKRALLEDQGIEDIRDIPEEIELSDLQERVRRAIVSQEPYVSPTLARALRGVRYPVHHLDFETFNPALPRYVDTRPFQMVPFQWSNHVEHDDGRVEHREYLCRTDIDPREAFVRSLVDALGTEGSVCVYSAFEARMIRELSELFSRYRQSLLAILERLWDLLPVVREHYYHPDFGGSFSIKRVLPALVPGLSYEGLEVADGQSASVAYAQSLDTADTAERSALHAALLEYCKQDTWAMVELRRALGEVAAMTSTPDQA